MRILPGCRFSVILAQLVLLVKCLLVSADFTFGLSLFDETRDYLLNFLLLEFAGNSCQQAVNGNTEESKIDLEKAFNDSLIPFTNLFDGHADICRNMNEDYVFDMNELQRISQEYRYCYPDFLVLYGSLSLVKYVNDIDTLQTILRDMFEFMLQNEDDIERFMENLIKFLKDMEGITTDNIEALKDLIPEITKVVELLITDGDDIIRALKDAKSLLETALDILRYIPGTGSVKRKLRNILNQVKSLLNTIPPIVKRLKEKDISQLLETIGGPLERLDSELLKEVLDNPDQALDFVSRSLEFVGDNKREIRNGIDRYAEYREDTFKYCEDSLNGYFNFAEANMVEFRDLFTLLESGIFNELNRSTTSSSVCIKLKLQGEDSPKWTADLSTNNDLFRKVNIYVDNEAKFEQAKLTQLICENSVLTDIQKWVIGFSAVALFTLYVLFCCGYWTQKNSDMSDKTDTESSRAIFYGFIGYSLLKAVTVLLTLFDVLFKRSSNSGITWQQALVIVAILLLALSMLAKGWNCYASGKCTSPTTTDKQRAKRQESKNGTGPAVLHKDPETGSMKSDKTQEISKEPARSTATTRFRNTSLKSDVKNGAEEEKSSISAEGEGVGPKFVQGSELKNEKKSTGGEPASENEIHSASRKQANDGSDVVLVSETEEEKQPTSKAGEDDLSRIVQGAELDKAKQSTDDFHAGFEGGQEPEPEKEMESTSTERESDGSKVVEISESRGYTQSASTDEGNASSDVAEKAVISQV